MKKFTFRDWAMLLIVAIVSYAAFQSQSASNTSNETVQDLAEIQKDRDKDQAIRTREEQCTSDILFAIVRAVNERTTFSTEQAKANIRVLKKQLQLVLVFADPVPDPAEVQTRFDNYLDALQTFVSLATQTIGQQNQYQYPTVEQYAQCLADARKPLPTDG